MNGYQINEDDIGKAIRYLKIHRPDKANREYAIQLLEILHGAAKRVATTDTGLAEDLETLLARGQNAEDEFRRDAKDANEHDQPEGDNSEK